MIAVGSLAGDSSTKVIHDDAEKMRRKQAAGLGSKGKLSGMIGSE